MKKCKMCNNMVDEKVEFCPYCGGNSFENGDYQQTNYVQNQAYYQPYQNYPGYPYYQYPAYNQNYQYPQKKGSFGWAVLGFFIPLVGLILFAVWNNDRKGDAKMAGIGALVGFITTIVLYIVFFAITMIIAFSAVSDYQENDYQDYYEVSSSCCEDAGGIWKNGYCDTNTFLFDEDEYDKCHNQTIY